MKNDTNIIKRLKRSLQVRMSLIIVVVTALVLEGVGLVQYLYLKKESSDPAALNIFVILLVIGFLMAVLLIIRALRNMKKLGALSASNEKMENELHIASAIQMSMLPKIFPPYPESADVDMFASMLPAKEVGGDLYDFYIRDNRLFFCIGDVSGKGIPASLVMAVTRSLFRTVSMHEKSPQRIVTVMNESMSDMNENDIFVTFFAVPASFPPHPSGLWTLCPIFRSGLSRDIFMWNRKPTCPAETGCSFIPTALPRPRIPHSTSSVKTVSSVCSTPDFHPGSRSRL